MDLQTYFEQTKGMGVLATSDSEGNVDLAIYGRPHVIDENTIAFIMRERLSFANLQSNPKAAYMFVEKTEGYKGTRLYLTKINQQSDLEIIEKFRELAKNTKKTIVLPEGEEQRMIEAAIFLDKQELVKPILLGNPEKIKQIAKSLGENIDHIEIINPEFSPYYNEWTDKFFKLRKHKNISREDAANTLKNELFLQKKIAPPIKSGPC